jgi:hypothetical protein
MLPECLIGFYIKHKQSKDVCYEVTNVKKLNGDYLYSLTIWNMGFEKSWVIDKCKVENVDLKNFVYYSDNIECLRNAQWKEF